MESVRASASCIGLTGTISVLRNFFGFWRGVVPPDPTGVKTSVSVRQQCQRLHQPHFHLNVILMGSDNFSDADHIELDYSIFKIRNIYAQVPIGVGRVLWWGIPASGADGLDNLTSEDEFVELSERVHVYNNGIDIAIPDMVNLSGTGNVGGKSPRGGPCEDKDRKGMDSSVSGLFGSEQTARSFAHEIGHYLGLEHENGLPDNLMCQSFLATSTRNSVGLYPGQGGVIRLHCLVKPGCP